jgi:hypothetical protein
MKTITSGPVRNCLADFFARFGTPPAFKEFFGLQKASYRIWRTKGVIPKGIILLKLYYFLEHVGYDVDELRNLSQDVYRNAGRGIAFGTINLDELSETIGTDHRLRFFEYFYRDIGISAERIEKMAGVVQKHADATAAASQKLTSRLAQDGIHITDADVTKIQHPLIARFRSACMHVRQLATELANESPEVRFEMRNIMGQGKEPELHLTFEALKKILNEQRK